VHVANLHNLKDKPDPGMVGALALAAASVSTATHFQSFSDWYLQVERALTLVATGTLTIPLVRASKNKTIPLPRTINLSSGKESMRQTGFSENAWGEDTRSYIKSTSLLKTAKFNTIIREAREFMKPVRSRGSLSATTEPIVVDDDTNERANIVDLCGSDSDCMLPPFFFTELTNMPVIS
jgi:hypothetical protein